MILTSYNMNILQMIWLI